MRRITILKSAKQLLITEVADYMCVCLKKTLHSKGFICWSADLKEIFPKFNITVAKEKFNASIKAENFEDPWWRYDNKEDRIAYFDYLIDFYREDKQTLRKSLNNYSYNQDIAD